MSDTGSQVEAVQANDEQPAETAVDVPWPDPDERARRPEPRGYPVTLADGKVWRLAPSFNVPHLDELRDRLFDQAALRNTYVETDVLHALAGTLLLNYRLAVDELFALVGGADLQAAVPSLESSLWGEPTGNHRKWSTWARTSLQANNIDPRKVDPADIGTILDTLVTQGRAFPPSWISSVEAGQKRRGLMERARVTRERQPPSPEPIPPPQGEPS